ncbi:MAG TPA: tetratricopeptide repeat protein [Vicinamibacterales bacterium]|nr:tetratricopeptide repeat protein [Vicinamibacterales bacterium]
MNEGRSHVTARQEMTPDPVETRMEPSTTTDRAVSLEEAVSIAIRLQQNDQWTAAADLYRRILEIAPDYADALHFSGVLAHQEGRSDEAIELIQKSLALEPDHADWYSNLAIVLRDRLRLEEAIEACRRAVAIDANHANALSNLGVLLRAHGDLAGAEEAYRAAIRVSPEHAEAYTNLGILLNAQKRTHEAVICFCKAITFRPKHPDARRLLALAHCTIGEVDAAVRIFDEWLAEEPTHPIALHMRAACSGHDVPARASDGFIETTFDSFAGSFDAKLAKLLYRAPSLVTAMLAEVEPEASKRFDVLDAGCGTGLCGPLLEPYARRLVGVDLSAGMLTQAHARKVYDELIKGELTAFFRSAVGAFDVIVSADTLVYFGPLDEVIAAAARTLRPGGRLIFTVEAWSDEASAEGYCLNTHGRYCHTRPYLEHVLASAGLRSEIVPAELRLEAGDPVDGYVVRATRMVTE